MADKSFGVNELNVISNSASAAGIVSCTNSMTVNAAQVGVTTNVSVTGVTTSGSFHSNDTTGDGTDVGFAIKYNITADGSSNYRFAGPGVLNTTIPFSEHISIGMLLKPAPALEIAFKLLLRYFLPSLVLLIKIPSGSLQSSSIEQEL